MERPEENYASILQRQEDEKLFQGLGVSPGIVIGPVYVSAASEISVPDYSLATRDLDRELNRLDCAIEEAQEQVLKLKRKGEDNHGESAEELSLLLDAHLQMLASKSMIGGIRARIQTGRKNAEAAVMAEAKQIMARFAKMDDPYLQGKAQEVREVALRLIRNLIKATSDSYTGLKKGSIILAEDITPADTAQMDPGTVGGFVAALGGPEGHTAIMARSLGLPAVLGIPDLISVAETSQTIIVDGSRGLVILNPTDERLKDYRKRAKAEADENHALAGLRFTRALTLDEIELNLHANIELPRETEIALHQGAEGIGLLRTEFMFMNREQLPDEEEQYQTLSTILEAMDGRPVTIRTLDAGGEKLVQALDGLDPKAINPALGLRAVRLSLKHSDLFKQQLAAILRASLRGPLRILLPLVTTAGEIRQTRRLLKEVADELRAKGYKIPEQLPPVGAMIEVPAAALAADGLARVADFFAIGTNDLTMYTLAIDRADDQVAYLYNPLHPAVLRLIEMTVRSANFAGIPVSVCGEVAGDIRYLPLLVGLGIRDLSMSAHSLPRVKKRALALSVEEAKRRTEKIMAQNDPIRIATLLEDFNDNIQAG